MFYTVTLPVTLWFLDRGKRDTDREGKVLFIDARQIYNPIDRAHRNWTPQQIEFLAGIVRLWRGGNDVQEEVYNEQLDRHFVDGRYSDVPGLCAVADIAEIQSYGWSLNPGRYVGLEAATSEAIDFEVSLSELVEEWELLSGEASRLSEAVSESLHSAWQQ